MDISVGMVSLGCAKNQVDAEMLMAALQSEGFRLEADAALADIAIVNTCGFIDSAKREAVEEILELAKLKEEGKIKKIVVTGCMAERYQEEIRREIPEVDAVMGIGANAEIANSIKAMLDKGHYESFPDKILMPLYGERVLSTPSYFAYIKIAEGCDNCCTYCAIPSIRGRFRSRSMEDIEQEAKNLVAGGAREIILIAQDTSRYGMDLYGEFSLAPLMKRLCKIDGIHWLRVLYCYPEAVTDELLEVMAAEDKIVKYMDLPLQHVSENILKAMNRGGSPKSLMELITHIRQTVPGITLRTTFITGFPGETEEDFEELANFVKWAEFDRMGCFPYSPEEGTPAATMPKQLDDETKLRRAELLMELQADVMERKGHELIGSDIELLVEGFDRYAECWFGRSPMDAPDIDCKVFVAPDSLPEGKKLSLGEFVQAEVLDYMDGDLFVQIEY